MSLGRVLVVEDNSKNLKLVRDVLTYSGFEVIEATSGEDGVAIGDGLVPVLRLVVCCSPSSLTSPRDRPRSRSRSARPVPASGSSSCPPRPGPDRDSMMPPWAEHRCSWCGRAHRRRSAPTRSSRPTGFTRYAAAPRAAPRACSSTMDTTITGMSRVSCSAFERRAAPPSRRSRATGCPAGPRRPSSAYSLKARPSGGRHHERGPRRVGLKTVDNGAVVLDDRHQHRWRLPLSGPPFPRPDVLRGRGVENPEGAAPAASDSSHIAPRGARRARRDRVRPQSGALLVGAATATLLEELEDPLAVHPRARRCRCRSP